MPHFRHPTLMVIAGAFMLMIGVMLLRQGLGLLVAFIGSSGSGYLFFPTVATFFGSHETLIIVAIVVSLLIGFLKGKYVIAKSARRGVKHITSLSNPAPLNKIYSMSTWIVIGVMMSLGMLMSVFKVPLDVRGIIDVAVGAALVQGASVFFRLARQHS